MDEAVPYWIELLAHFYKEKTTRQIHKFISQFRHKTGYYYSIYIRQLLKAGNIDKLKETLNHKFIDEEKKEVIEVLVNYDLENNTAYGNDFFLRLKEEKNYVLDIYFLIKDNKIPVTYSLPNNSDFPFEINYDTSICI